MRPGGGYWERRDLLVGLDGLCVIGVDAGGERLTVTVGSAPRVADCRACGVLAHSHGRGQLTVSDAPCSGRPVRVVWRKRTWRCGERDCESRSLSEADAGVAGPGRC